MRRLAWLIAVGLVLSPASSSPQSYAPQPDPLQPIIKRLLGAWVEDSKSPYTVKKFSAGRMPARRSVEFFRDGTGISQSDDGPGLITEQFTWALSEDGKRIRTTGPQRVYLARIVFLTDRELHIEGPSLANGHFLRE
jgi:hypothetical protein